MNRDHQSSGNAGVVIAVLLVLVILGIGAIGLGLGFFFFAAARVTALPTPVVTKMGAAPVLGAVNSAASVIGTFELAPLDVKDQLEAPAIAVSPGGQVLVAYASQTGKEERTLRIARSTDGITFDAPRELRKTKIYQSVSQHDGKEVKRPIRLLPQLAVGGGKVYLGWVEPNEDNTTVIYYIAESSDDGETFSEPIRVHESDGAKPAFTSLAADPQGNVVAAWLDNRAGIKQPFAAIKRAGETKFQIEAQVYSSPNESGVCPCCPTAAVIGPDEQVHVAFRNQLDGFRDIYVGQRAVSGEGEFTMLRSVVAQPTWTFDGCPHDGPSLAIDNMNLYVAWMDASSGTPRCYFAQKPLGGGNFTAPQPLNPQSSGAEGNARLLVTDATVIAVWEGDSSVMPCPISKSPSSEAIAGRAIYMAYGQRVQPPEGININWRQPQSIAATPCAFQTRPALAQHNGRLFAVWHELDEAGKRVVVARLPDASSL